LYLSHLKLVTMECGVIAEGGWKLPSLSSVRDYGPAAWYISLK
jgi:hypothetical protein